MKVHLVLAIFVACLSCASVPAFGADPATASSEARESATVGAAAEKGTGEALRMLEAIQSQQREMAQELRAVKREIAALKVALNEPSLKDIIGGIGYILGVFGIAFYLHARRRHPRSGP